MARKKENMNLATEIICQVKRQLIICRVALAVSLAGNAIMAAMLICKQSRHGAAGITILLPFSFTGNPAASIAHNMRGMLANVGFFLYWQYGSSHAEQLHLVAFQANSGFQWDILIIPGIYKHYTRAGENAENARKCEQKKKVYKKLHKKRIVQNWTQKRVL